MVTQTRKRRPGGAGEATAALPKVSEKAFQAQVERYLRLNSWLVYHTYLSIRSAPGFPDICAVRAGRVAFIELKTIDGKISAAQAEWGEALGAVGGTVEYHLLRPTERDWQLIESMFR